MCVLLLCNVFVLQILLKSCKMHEVVLQKCQHKLGCMQVPMLQWQQVHSNSNNVLAPRGGLIEWEGGKERGGEEGEGNKRETWRNLLSNLGLFRTEISSELIVYYYSTGKWQRVHSNSYNVLVPPRGELIEWEGGKERWGEEGEGNNNNL